MLKKEGKKVASSRAWTYAPWISMQWTVVLAYLNTRQSGGNALGRPYPNKNSPDSTMGKISMSLSDNRQ
jgi:hypothetical protein